MEVRHGFDAEDLVSRGRITWEELKELRDKLGKLRVPRLTDEQLALLILSCDRDLDFTVTTIREYYASRKAGGAMFADRDVSREEVQYQLGVVQYSVFPARMPDGCAIVFHRLQDFCYSHYDMETCMKVLFMTLDSAIFDDPPTGLVILFDMKGVGLMHLTRVRLGLVRTFCHYLQDGLPVKLREVHVLNANYLIDKVLAIVKPFIKKELLSKIHFHTPDIDMDDFHKNVIPKECLPSDFGGTLPDAKTLHEQNTKKLSEMKPFFDAEERQRLDFYEKS